MGRFANEEWKPARKMWPPKGKWLGKKGLINSSSEESGVVRITKRAALTQN